MIVNKTISNFGLKDIPLRTQESRINKLLDTVTKFIALKSRVINVALLETNNPLISNTQRHRKFIAQASLFLSEIYHAAFNTKESFHFSRYRK